MFSFLSSRTTYYGFSLQLLSSFFHFYPNNALVLCSHFLSSYFINNKGEHDERKSRNSSINKTFEILKSTD